MTHKTKTPKLGSRVRPAYQRFCWVPKDTRRVIGVLRVVAGGNSAIKHQIPCITMRGDWLRKAGFPIGSRFLIQVDTRGSMTIDRI